LSDNTWIDTLNTETAYSYDRIGIHRDAQDTISLTSSTNNNLCRIAGLTSGSSLSSTTGNGDSLAIKFDSAVVDRFVQIDVIDTHKVGSKSSPSSSTRAKNSQLWLISFNTTIQIPIHVRMSSRAIDHDTNKPLVSYTSESIIEIKFSRSVGPSSLDGMDQASSFGWSGSMRTIPLHPSTSAYQKAAMDTQRDQILIIDDNLFDGIAPHVLINSDGMLYQAPNGIVPDIDLLGDPNLNPDPLDSVCDCLFALCSSMLIIVL
jgi:hypothetical protein